MEQQITRFSNANHDRRRSPSLPLYSVFTTAPTFSDVGTPRLFANRVKS